MLAPANSPREICNSVQLESRGFFGPFDDVERFPRSFAVVRSADGEAAPIEPRLPTTVGSKVGASRPLSRQQSGGRAAWSGVNILEFGSGAAGPIATRYFSENGATVLRIESRTRPDFLRAMALAIPSNPVRSRGFAAVRRPQRRQAQSHAEPQEARSGRARLAARDRVGRRGRRELRAARDEELRPRLRHARDAQARPRDGERVPQRADRAAQGLSGFRRPGFGARRLQRAHRLARPRAGRPVRHDHRLARTALRRGRARGGLALPAPHGPGRLPRRVAGRVRDLVPVAVVARLRARRRDPSPRRQQPS